MDGLMSGIFASAGITIAISLIFTIVVLFFVFRIFRNVTGGIKSNNQLLMTGEPAQATVLRLWDTGVMLNNNPQVGLALEVQPSNRPSYQVETKQFISHIRLSQVQPGSTVAVRVDPTDPSKVALALM